MNSTLQLVIALPLLTIILGSFVFIDVQVLTNKNWLQGFQDRLFNPYYMVYYALIAPAGIYWSQKVILDNSKGSVWAVSILAAALLQLAGIGATLLASGQYPNFKEIIALLLIGIITFWSRT